MKCKCGCGEDIEIKEYHLKTGYKPKYIKGHYIRVNNPMKNPEIAKKLSGENSFFKRNKFIGKNNGFYGKTHTNSQKKKWSEGRTGIKRSKTSKIKQSISIMGDKHWNWKGGISNELYCDSWLDSEYKESIKERDGYLCVNPECNKITNVLCIHHIDYNKKNCHSFNLITICISCNVKANYDRMWHKSWYDTIIYRRYGRVYI